VSRWWRGWTRTRTGASSAGQGVRAVPSGSVRTTLSGPISSTPRLPDATSYRIRDRAAPSGNTVAPSGPVTRSNAPARGGSSMRKVIRTGSPARVRTAEHRRRTRTGRDHPARTSPAATAANAAAPRAASIG
jgi:hypothetical protein